jgi:hypothetical protein
MISPKYKRVQVVTIFVLPFKGALEGGYRGASKIHDVEARFKLTPGVNLSGPRIATRLSLFSASRFWPGTPGA